MAQLKQKCPGCGKLAWHTFDVAPGGFNYHCQDCGRVHREDDFRRMEEEALTRRWDIDGHDNP